MRTIVAADIGGTHARFALARLDGAKVLALDHVSTLEAAAHPDLETAYRAFGAGLPEPAPPVLSMALAGPTEGEALRLTNNPWVIRPSHVRAALGLSHLEVLNDFAAVGHAIGAATTEDFELLSGPAAPLPSDGLITVMGPGTGLGVAQVLRREGRATVLPTEGGHIDFAPLDETEDRILVEMRRTYGRVSVERILSGAGLFSLYRALGHMEGRKIEPIDQRALWASAIEGHDRLASEALERFCLTLGSVAGDIALAQGASAVVLAGGLTPRIAARLPRSGFAARFVAKGRFSDRMRAIPIFRILHPQPGLLGAAAAFAAM